MFVWLPPANVIVKIWFCPSTARTKAINPFDPEYAADADADDKHKNGDHQAQTLSSTANTTNPRRPLISRISPLGLHFQLPRCSSRSGPDGLIITTARRRHPRPTTLSLQRSDSTSASMRGNYLHPHPSAGHSEASAPLLVGSPLAGPYTCGDGSSPGPPPTSRTATKRGGDRSLGT